MDPLLYAGGHDLDRQLADKDEPSRSEAIRRPVTDCARRRLPAQNMYWPPFKWMACPLTKLPVVQR